MRHLFKTATGWGLRDGGAAYALKHTLTQMLCGAPLEASGDAPEGDALAPIDDQEVWAAGVTYSRSLDARAEESTEPDIYDRVYRAERPELFFKSIASRVAGDGQDAFIRPDSTWDVPEPELTLVLDAKGQIFGYTIGDDMSSRSIEGENPLYLPQAKIYDRSAVLGPTILLADDATPPFDIATTITRDGDVVFTATTSTSKMTRDFDDLRARLFTATTFPVGVFLMTGTGIVPDADLTLMPGDVVAITIDQIGTLTHGVRRWS